MVDQANSIDLRALVSQSESVAGAASSLDKSILELPSLFVHCRWLRYPEASSFSLSLQKQGVSSVGFRVSEEHSLLQAVHHEARNENFFRDLLAWYVAEHNAWRNGSTKVLKGAIIAVCYGLPYCGGHGDRVHGILSLLLLAIATKRGFLIDSRFPLPLDEVLQPSFLDWRVRVEEIELNNRIQLVDLTESEIEKSLRGFRDSPEVLAIGTNLRFHSYMLQWLREEHGGFSLTSSWVQDAWNYLFKPTPVILELLRSTTPEAHEKKTPFLAIHFRAGNETLHSFLDPARHSLDLLEKFLDCALAVEAGLSKEKKVEMLSPPQNTEPESEGKAILDPKIPFYLSADTNKVWDHPRVQKMMTAGKLKPFIRGDAESIQHVDRSPALNTIATKGFHRSWVEYLSLSRATALIISNSFFGETAAEIGNVPFVYYGEACIAVDL